MKFKIFISSNRKEFLDERRLIKESIEKDIVLNRFFKVFAFEEEPARGISPNENYGGAILESDIYIGLIGSAYGTILETGISPTETEYNLFNYNENTYFFLKDVYKREEKTERFIKRIQEKHSYQTFYNKEELILEVKRSLSDFLDNNLNNIKRNFDKKILKNSSIADLDKETYDLFFDMVTDDSIKELKEIRTEEEILSLINAGEIINNKFYFNNAGALCFCKDIRKFDIEHEIKMVKFNSNTREDILDMKNSNKNIFKLLNELKSFFKRNTRKSRIIIGFDGITIREYPFEAIREGLINALAHRDYTINTSPITFYIYENRIEIINPGNLISPVNIENLGKGNPAHRNKNICYILSKTKYMEHVGTGINRMKEIMNNEELREPEFYEEKNSFKVIFWGRDKDLDLNNLKNKNSELKDLKINERQFEALSSMKNKKTYTIKDYVNQFNISRQTAYRDLNDLIKKDLIIKEKKGRFYYFKIKD